MGRTKSQGNVYDNMATHMSEIPGHETLDVVTVIDRDTGNVLIRLERNGSAWKVVR